MENKPPAVRQTVKKHVAAIHTSGELTFLERKLVNVLLLNAYDRLLTQVTHTIPVAILCEMLGWEESNNIDRLKAALVSIQKTVLQYDLLNKKGQNKNWLSVTLLAAARIEDGICTYQYSEFLANELANPGMYATINIGVQNQFKSGYALTLYENCMRFKQVGTTGWIGVDLWRQMLGAEAAHYDAFKKLSNEVIKYSVSEVNKVSDIEITPEYQRQARRVKNIRFAVKPNSQQTIFDNGALDGLTEPETETLKRLLGYGIGEKLALAWIAQDPGRAAHAAEQVDDIEKTRPLKNSAGYLRTVFESDSPIKARGRPAKAAGEATVAESTSQPKKDAVKALTPDELRAYAADYLAGDGAGSAKKWSEERLDFSNATERFAFRAWIISQMAESPKK